MLVEKVRDLGLDRPGEQGTGPITQDFGELTVEESWRISLITLSLGTAYRSFGGKVEASPRYAAFPISAVTNSRR
jgi:hypothetical protein